MNKLITVKLHCKLRLKYKKKRYKIFNTKINNDTVFFFLDSEEKKKVSNEIAALFKKTVMILLYA